MISLSLWLRREKAIEYSSTLHKLVDCTASHKTAFFIFFPPHISAWPSVYKTGFSFKHASKTHFTRTSVSGKLIHARLKNIVWHQMRCNAWLIGRSSPTTLGPAEVFLEQLTPSVITFSFSITLKVIWTCTIYHIRYDDFFLVSRWWSSHQTHHNTKSKSECFTYCHSSMWLMWWETILRP